MNKGIHDDYVMPQWLPFPLAAKQRGFNSFTTSRKRNEAKVSDAAFMAAYDDFNATPIPYIATELMGIAQIAGLEEHAKRLSEYVIKIPNPTKACLQQAHAILGNIADSKLQDERASIRELKAKLSAFPKDSLIWLERARLHTILGQKDKAEREIRIALALAPTNRHIVRSAVRFFVHYDDWEQAYHYSNRAFRNNPDPQILAPLVGVSSHLGKVLPSLKAAANNALASQEFLLNSELLEAVGTMELMAGSENSAKKFFRQAWRDPTVPVIGHSQWVLREKIPGLSHERAFHFTESQEAISWLKFSFLDFEGAIVSSNCWALEEPYSKSPYILGSIAACHAGQYEKAIEIGLRGLRANPKDEILLNNLAFSYLRNGQPEKARRHFDHIKHLAKVESEIAITATYGLLLMAEGDQDAGCELYVAAIERAWKTGQRRTALRASINFLISTIDTAKSADPALVGAIIQALPYYQDPGCYGAAFTALKRMRETGLSITPALGPSYRELDEITKKESSHYVGIIQGRFMDVIGLRGGTQRPSLPEHVDEDSPKEPKSLILDGIRNIFRF